LKCRFNEDLNFGNDIFFWFIYFNVLKHNLMMLRKFALKYLIIIVLAIPGQSIVAQNNYRPATSKGTDHSYFKNGKINIINSSHQDIAWMDSIGACEIWRDENMITPVLEIMATNKSFCFTVEDALCLKEYLKRHPEKYPEILKYTKEGRLEWGATYVQPYESMYDGEALIRQTYLGRKWLKEMLPGSDFLCAYSPDVPGRALQMSQILFKSGIKYLHFSRHEPGIYRWYSPDGSNVLAFTPGQYDEAGRPMTGAKTDEEAKAAFVNYLNVWNEYFKKHKISPYMPFYYSTDWSKPNEFKSLTKMWNESSKKEKLPVLNFSTGTHALAAIDNNAKFEIIKGERPNVWLYIHGPTHEKALSASRKANRMLIAAEKFASINAILDNDFSVYPQSDFTRSWEKAIYPDHGWGGVHGELTDLTFRKGFETALNISTNVFHNSVSDIANSIDFKKEGYAVVVFNPLSWERTDKVEVSVNAFGKSKTSFKIIDANSGEEVPCQRIVSVSTVETDEVVTITFIADKVPSMGYKTYYLQPFMESVLKEKAGARGGYTNQIPEIPTNPSTIDSASNSGSFENQFYKLSFGPGGLKSIYDKQLQKELLQSGKFLGGEVFQLESVGNGAGEFSDVQPTSMNGFEKVSQYNPSWTCSEFGPVRKSWEFTQQTKFATIHQKVTLYENLKQIEFNVDILGFSGEHYREYRMAFPLNQTQSTIAYEVPMGVVEVGKDEIKGAAGFSKPDQIYSTECAKVHPREVQDWFNASSNNTSVNITSSVAVFDWIDPTDETNNYTILQPVLLASRRSCHGQGNFYLQPGNHSYTFTFTSGSGTWKNNIQSGKQSNMPLQPVIVKAQNRQGGLTENRSFVQVNKNNVIVSALKKTDNENNYIIRLYEVAGEDTDVTVTLPLSIEKLWKTDMIEENGTEIPSSGNSFTFKIGHNAIETFKIKL
jgi:alpha-mannosidase